MSVHEGYLVRGRDEPNASLKLGERTRNAKDERACATLEMVEAAIVKSTGEDVHALCMCRMLTKS